jgi:hypothetical protein
MSALVFLLALQAAAPGPGAAGDRPVVVHLADGNSLPLREWSLSYEYVAWPAGSSQAFGTTARRDTRELWAAKKRLDTAGLVMELEHRMVPHVPGQGMSGPPEIPTVSRLRLRWPGGRKDDLKPEPPHRDRLLAGGARDVMLLARSLDLRGVTLAGTKRLLCVLSYTSLVECGVERAGRVVKLEFPRKE